jgi:flagellar operon protein
MNVRTTALAHKAALARGPRPAPVQPKSGEAFGALLDARMDGVRFSAHARARLKSREIDVTPEVMEKLDRAVDGARKKGSRESLVLLSDLAFIVNVRNRTVVTAMDGESVRERVFTNIDSTVIAG